MSTRRTAEQLAAHHAAQAEKHRTAALRAKNPLFAQGCKLFNMLHASESDVPSSAAHNALVEVLGDYLETCVVNDEKGARKVSLISERPLAFATPAMFPGEE